MNLTIDRDAFAATLGRVAPFADPRSPIPVLTCVRLIADGQTLAVSATDMDAAITETLPAMAGEPGAVCIAGDKLRALVSSLRPGLAVELSQEKTRLRLRAGRTSAAFDVHPAEDYPEFKTDLPAPQFAVKAAELDRVLTMHGASMSADIDRAYLNGIFFCLEQGRIRAVSTDGKRGMLGRLNHESGRLGDFPAMILPRPTCLRLRALLKGHSGSIEFSIDKSRARIAGGIWTLTSKLIDGTFPDHTLWAAQPTEQPVVVNADDLLPVLERMEAVLDADASKLRLRGIHIDVADNDMRLRGGGAITAPDIEDAIPVQYAGPPIGLGFNTKFMREGIAALGGGEIELHFIDPSSPFMVRGHGETDESATILPYRV